jgi:hypothetical protein
VAHTLICYGPRPGPPAGCFVRQGVDSFEAPIIDTQRVVGVNVVDEPDLIDTVAVQIERVDRGEPDARHDARTEIAPPENLSIHREQRELQRTLRKEEHLDVRIDLGVRAVYGQNRLGRAFTEIDRDGPQLAGRLTQPQFQNAL